MTSLLNRPATTPDAILDGFKAKLLARSDLTGLNDDTIVIVQRRGVSIPQPGFVWVGLRLTGGAFRGDEFAGGGSQGLFVDSQMIVEIHSGNQLDPGGENDSLLGDDETGLLPTSTGILQALAIDPEFDLVDADGNGLLAEKLEPLDWQLPEADRAKGLASFAFRCCFLWDASAPT